MGDSTILHPGEDMLHEHFPGLSADGTTLTFDRDDALAHEDREFLTWEHPMVLGAIDALTSVELGSTAFVLMKSAGVKPGTLLLEMIHLAESIAPPELEIGRFFPPTAIRSLFDVKGRDLSHKIKPEQIRGDCLSRQHKLAKTIINSQSAILRDLMGAGAEQAERKMAGIIDAAVGRMETELTHERTRLEALAKVNPNVRSEEIDYLLTKQLLLKRHLEQSRVRLDAVRVVVFS
jgi:ATP-dependent helicase HepA